MNFVTRSTGMKFGYDCTYEQPFWLITYSYRKTTSYETFKNLQHHRQYKHKRNKYFQSKRKQRQPSNSVQYILHVNTCALFPELIHTYRCILRMKS